jgi:hypothetical protein
MKCSGTIDDPYLHKKKSPPPKLAIPLHGKIISASGVTNLSEITAASEEYSQGFDPSTIRVPGQFELGTNAPPPVYREQAKNRTMTAILALVFILVIGGGLTLYYFLVLHQPAPAANETLP